MVDYNNEGVNLLLFKYVTEKNIFESNVLIYVSIIFIIIESLFQIRETLS